MHTGEAFPVLKARHTCRTFQSVPLLRDLARLGSSNVCATKEANGDCQEVAAQLLGKFMEFVQTDERLGLMQIASRMRTGRAGQHSASPWYSDAPREEFQKKGAIPDRYAVGSKPRGCGLKP